MSSTALKTNRDSFEVATPLVGVPKPTVKASISRSKESAREVIAVDSKLKWNPFGAKYGNYNSLLSGGESEKNSFLNALAQARVRSGDRVVVFDFDALYRESIDRRQLTRIGVSNFALNPFRSFNTDGVCDGDQMDLTAIALGILLSPKRAIPTFSAYWIEKAMDVLIERKEARNIQSIVNWLLKHPVYEARGLGWILSYRCGSDCEYAELFDRSWSLKKSPQYQAFDFSGFGVNQGLKSAAFLLMANQVVTQFDYKKKLIVIVKDGAKGCFSHPSMVVAIEMLLRRAIEAGVSVLFESNNSVFTKDVEDKINLNGYFGWDVCLEEVM